MPSISPSFALAGAGDLLRLAYRRFVKSNLYIPANTPVHLQLDMEQVAVRENYVRLVDQMDAFGRRLASVRWQVSNRDIAEITEVAQRFMTRWQDARCELPTLLPKVIGIYGSKSYDAYHPVGTCRMGEGIEAVVDYKLKVYGVKNLWVASTGVLPSAGTANPTFTMLCLTHELARNLKADY